MRNIVILFIFVFTSCTTQRVLKTDSQNGIDLSGRWNETDAEIAASQMFNNLISSSWFRNYEGQDDFMLRIEVLAFDSNFKNGGETLEKFFSKFIDANTKTELISKDDRKLAEVQLVGSAKAEEFITEKQNYIDYVLKAEIKDLSGVTLWEDNAVVKKYIKE